ncbi:MULTISPECIES: hypothetical protein [unclassified Clostridioides]|uniref:hypothetical protein n=1 Tax=unclassified Clostridioides TaxID=2635829 RepID=UPI001D119E9D|nr:hypothetical protein [Clostridioides sp. ES-S-0049-03]MCC0678473.1 hypothetical protein [Clostridioides sp. ES-W-0018-02]MCC0713316.1 hypothetical protein [Clostridioides sp. ES-W-0017-02]
MSSRLLANKAKEDLSISEIKKLCVISGNIEAEIESNDKTPSWDGVLFLYKKIELDEDVLPNNKKENLLKKINTQLKAIQVKKFSGKKIKFSMDVSDLRNYYNNEGVILFVVEIIDVYKLKVYYRNLLPLDLKDILNEIDRENIKRKKRKNPNNQLTKSVELYELLHGENTFEKIVDSFYRNINKQTKNLVDKQIRLNKKAKKFSIDIGHINNEYDLFDRRAYAYQVETLKNSNTDILVPCIDNLKFEELNSTDIVDIIINNKIYSNNKYTLIFNKNGYKIIINEALYLYLKDEKFELSDPTGTIDSYLETLKMLIDVIKFKNVTMKIGGTSIKAKIHNFDLKEKQITKKISFFANLKKLFKILKLKQEDFLLEVISSEDYDTLEELINIFVKKKRNLKLNGDNYLRFAKIDIGNKKILLYKLTSGDNVNFFNVFDNECKILIEQKKINMKYSPYVLLRSEDMECVNFDIDKANIDIKNYEKTIEYINCVILYILELIRCYDKVHNEKCLTKALELLDWIGDTEPFNINKINKLQIMKRLRDLNIDEIIELVNIKNQNPEDIAIQCAVNILIEKFEEARNNMSDMNEELLKEFKLYPIYSLMKS